MVATTALALVAFTSSAMAGHLAPPETASPAQPFASASLAPPDVDFLLRVREFPRVWSTLEEAPLGRYLAARFAESELAEAWTRFASERGEDPGRLAAKLLHRDATWMTRRNGARQEWVLLTRLDDPERRRLLAEWRPRPLGRGWFDLEREGLLLVDAEGHLVIAGSGSRDLLVAVVSRLGDDPSLASLRERCSLEDRVEIREGEIECYLNRRPWTDEAMLATASASPGSLVAELHAATSASRADGQRTTLQLDETFEALVGRLKTEHLVVVASAAGVPMPFAAEWLAALPEAAIAPALGSAAGTRRLWVVGETSGLGDDPDRMLPTPAVAFAVELRDSDEAEARLDRWGETLAAGFNRRFPSLAMPPLSAAPTIEGGSIDLGPLLTRLMGDHPLARRVRVDWSVSNGVGGSWAIVASGPAWLRSVQGDFESGAAAIDANSTGDFENLPELDASLQEGWLRGEAVGRHFERWMKSADRLASEPDREAFVERWRRVAEAARAIGDVRWTVVRSPSGAIRTAIRIGGVKAGGEVRPDSPSDED